MKIIPNTILPGKGYSAMYVAGLLFVRKEVTITDRMLRHESIHARQCWEMSPIFFYIWYVLEWLFRLVQYRDRKQAYYNISFEREAYNNQNNVNYLSERKCYSWIKYLKKNG